MTDTVVSTGDWWEIHGEALCKMLNVSPVGVTWLHLEIETGGPVRLALERFVSAPEQMTLIEGAAKEKTEDEKAFDQMARLAERMATILQRARGDLGYAQEDLGQDKRLTLTSVEIDRILEDARDLGVFPK